MDKAMRQHYFIAHCSLCRQRSIKTCRASSIFKCSKHDTHEPTGLEDIKS